MQPTNLPKPEERLQELPGNWRYAIGSREEQAIFHQIVAELLAEEVSGLGRGALSTVVLTQIIESVAGHQVKTWLPAVRKILKRVPAAEALIAKTSEAKLESAKAKSETDHAKAVQELELANQRVIDVETKVKTATFNLQKFRESDKMLNNPKLTHSIPAIKHLQRLRGNG